jgi:hypothetical protein
MNLVLCSELDGTLIDKDRKPVPDVKVKRTWHWHWKNKKGEQEVVTDAEGRFAFPAVRRFGVLPAVFPHEAMIEMRLYARAPGISIPVLLMLTAKRNYRENGELNGRRPLRMVFRIDMEQRVFPTGFVGTVVEMER